MQTEFIHRNAEINDIRSISLTQASCLRVVATPHAKSPVSFRVRRHEVCAAKRAAFAAIRQAELEEWLATGGDHLTSMHQPMG